MDSYIDKLKENVRKKANDLESKFKSAISDSDIINKITGKIESDINRKIIDIATYIFVGLCIIISVILLVYCHSLF